MKIAFVSQPVDLVIPPHQNSLGIWTFQVARRLAKDHDVTVFLRRTRSQNRTDEANNIGFRFVRTIPLRSWKLMNFPPFTSRKHPLHAAVFHSADYALQVAKDIRRGGFDIIHIQNIPHFAPIIRAFNPAAKIVLHMHCEWLSQLDRELMEQRLCSVDLVLGCGHHITSKVRERFPHSADRCHTVYNGVDAKAFTAGDRSRSKSENTESILFVGRITPEKGIHVLVDAFAIVRRAFPQANLKLIGPFATTPKDFIVTLSEDEDVTKLAAFYQGAYLDQLKARMPADIADSVIFSDGMPHAMLAREYAQADVLVNPSFSESFGMSLIEAMACERPVVASRVGGMIEIVDEGVTGFLVEPGKAEQLAAAIIRVLANRESSKAMGKAGRLRAKALFSWDRITVQLATQYRQLLKGAA